MLIPNGRHILEEFFVWFAEPGPLGSGDAHVLGADAGEGWIDLHGSPPAWPAEVLHVVFIREAVERWYGRTVAQGGEWAASNSGYLSLLAKHELWNAIHVAAIKRPLGASGDVIVDDYALR